MSHNPTKDITDYLDTNSTALTVGTNLFYGLVRSVSSDCPAESVFVMASGGRQPARVFGSSGEIRYPRIQVRIRSDTFQNGYTLAQTVFGILQSATPTNYMDVVAQQSEPTFLGADERGLMHWSINYLAKFNTT